VGVSGDDVVASRALRAPWGKIRISVSARGVREVRLDQVSRRDRGDSPILDEVVRQLEEYFQGERRRFDLPFDLHGTEFQRRVWKALARVPFGATLSYGDLARKAGSARGYRAVGQAVGRNPLPILVPCHRVLAAGGGLGGFSGGLPLKKRLLAIEGHSFVRG